MVVLAHFLDNLTLLVEAKVIYTSSRENKYHICWQMQQYRLNPVHLVEYSYLDGNLTSLGG